mmetsp:Transcript_11396/g.26443  ORF Transcript_11396/g.26443 Transcript_11396/m.26443 type:complete len:127 (-) Transcript_11396:343-723(-)
MHKMGKMIEAKMTRILETKQYRKTITTHTHTLLLFSPTHGRKGEEELDSFSASANDAMARICKMTHIGDRERHTVSCVCGWEATSLAVWSAGFRGEVEQGSSSYNNIVLCFSSCTEQQSKSRALPL